MKDFRKQFPLLRQYTYLNTAESGLFPEEVFDFRQNHDLDMLISGSILREQQTKILVDVREAVGSLFHCRPERIGLTPNFSYGFNTLMGGVPESYKVLLLKDDYPVINWAVESRGLKTFYVEIDKNLEANIAEAVEKYKPNILALSLVQYMNGIKINMDFLAQLKQDYPEILIFADGTQYCGTEEFNFDSSGIDVLGASGYKWMNAGYGNGFYLFKETVLGKVASKSLDFRSLQGNYKSQEGDFLGRFEPGHLDSLAFGSLLTAVRLINKIGIKNIENSIGTLALAAKQYFESENLLKPEVENREIHSSIFNIHGDDALFRYLNSNNIICSQRAEGIRISFHYFNSFDDLEILKQALQNWFRGKK